MSNSSASTNYALNHSSVPSRASNALGGSPVSPSAFSAKPSAASFSGADYIVNIYIPLDQYGDANLLIERLKEELVELKNQKSVIEKNTSDAALSALGYAGGGPLSLFPNVSSGLVASSFGVNKELQNINAQIEKVDGLIKKAKEAKNKSASPVQLKNLQTLSYQIHTDKQPVRAVGHKFPKSYSAGQSLIAGSMIFTIEDQHPLIDLIDTYNTSLRINSNASVKRSSAIADQLPPFNATILAVNELGSAAITYIKGIQFINDGNVMSIQDILTESTLSFVATDIDIMRSLNTRGAVNIAAIDRVKTVSSFVKVNKIIERRISRNSPF